MSNRSLFIKIYKLIDILTVIICFWVTNSIDTGTRLSFSSLMAINVKLGHLGLIVFFLMAWHVVFSVVGLYRSKRLGSRYYELIDILKCTSVGSIIMMVSGFLFGIEILSATFISIFWGITSFFLITGRLVIRRVLAVFRKQGINQRNLVIVGTGQRAVDFAGFARNKRELGYNLLGFVDDRLYIKNSESEKVEMLGNLHELNNILNSHVVDEVMISLPIKSYYNEIEAIIKQCEKQGVVVRLLTDIFTVSLAKSQLSYVDEVPVLTLYSAPYEDSRMIVKRDLDIVLSFGLIILLLPVLLVVAAAIKLTSPGPALFIQKRVGYNKRIFSMLKFRTMIAGAEELLPSLEEINESGGATFKLKNDPRVTKLGRFLRRSSLDEMPQLLNVLKGDMSLVGPRPLPVRDYKGFDSDWQKRRFSMKPGLTCFWQIGGRSNVSFSRWMQMDMEYIDKWSLWLDLKILWKTIPVVFSGRGAV